MSADRLRANPQPGAAKRILVVTHGYPPRHNNGAELHIQRKVHWWLSHGHDVRVAAADPIPAGAMPYGASIETRESVEGVDVRRIRFSVADASHPFLDTYRNPILERFVEAQVNDFSPDVVYQVSGYVFGVIPIEAAERHSLPAVLFAVDYWHVCSRVTLLRPDGECCAGPRSPADCAACRVVARRPFNAFGTRLNTGAWAVISSAGKRVHDSIGLDPAQVTEFELRRDAIARALDYVSLVVANSRFLVENLRALGVPEERILMVRQGLEMKRYPAPAEPHSGLNVLFLGQLSYHKGIDLLADAVSNLIDDGYDIRLRAFGPSTNGRFNYVSSDRMQIQGAISHEEIWSELQNADVLVAPARWYENSPNVILEAQALGVPVITADHGGTAEMVRHGLDGLLFRPGDAGSLEHALWLLLSDPELLEYLRSNITPPHGMDVEMAVEERALDHLLCTAIVRR